MYALMIAFLSMALVGASVTAQKTSEVPVLVATEESAAINFIRYTNAMKCYFEVTGSHASQPPALSILKTTMRNGEPCLHASYASFVPDKITGPMAPGEFRTFHMWSTNFLITYSSPRSLKGTPFPIGAVQRVSGIRSSKIGFLAADFASVIGPGGEVVGTVPLGAASAAKIGLEVGSPVQLVTP
jgi:hypothetical protein